MGAGFWGHAQHGTPLPTENAPVTDNKSYLRPCHGESAKKKRQEEKESKESKSTILQLQQLSQSLPTAGSNKSHLHAQL